MQNLPLRKNKVSYAGYRLIEPMTPQWPQILTDPQLFLSPCRVIAHKPTAYDHLLDFGCALPDQQHRRVPL